MEWVCGLGSWSEWLILVLGWKVFWLLGRHEENAKSSEYILHWCPFLNNIEWRTYQVSESTKAIPQTNTMTSRMNWSVASHKGDNSLSKCWVSWVFEPHDKDPLKVPTLSLNNLPVVGQPLYACEVCATLGTIAANEWICQKYHQNNSNSCPTLGRNLVGQLATSGIPHLVCMVVVAFPL